jgi:hypothetical protein
MKEEGFRNFIVTQKEKVLSLRERPAVVFPVQKFLVSLLKVWVFSFNK